MKHPINLIALAAGILTIVLITVSFFVPWWKFTIGTGAPSIAAVNFSPTNFNFALFGNDLTIPLIWALNLASLLTLLSGGLVMVVYAMLPTKQYSKKLLGFAYKKPLYAVILFVIEIVALSLLVRSIAGLSFPMLGATTMQLPANMAPNGVSIGVSVSAAFEWPFYLSIATAALCIVARVYHRKIVANAVPPLATQI